MEAIEFRRLGRMPSRAAGPFYQDYYKDDKEGRIALLNCLAAYNTTIAARSKNKQVPAPLLPRRSLRWLLKFRYSVLAEVGLRPMCRLRNSP